MKTRRATGTVILLAVVGVANPPGAARGQEAAAGPGTDGLEAAESALEAGQVPEARAALDTWLAASPGAPAERTARARYLRARLTADPDSAEMDYAWAAVEGGATYAPRARLALAQLRLARGEARRALEDLERLRLDYPGSALVALSWLWTGHALEADGDPEGACAAWSRAASAPPTDAVREEAAASLAGCAGDRFAVQLGAFRDGETAERRRRELTGLGLALRVEAPREAGGWYRLRAGPFSDREEAGAVAERLARQGVDAIVVEDR